MLYGFALENLVKGVIVCREPDLVTKDGLRNWPGQSHDLARLFERAEVSVTEEERAALEIVSQLIEWSGRYPTPMRFAEHGRKSGWPPSVYARLRDLFAKAKAEITKTMAEIPPLPAGHNFADKRTR
jgi:hypothetical protein